MTFKSTADLSNVSCHVSCSSLSLCVCMRALYLERIGGKIFCAIISSTTARTCAVSSCEAQDKQQTVSGNSQVTIPNQDDERYAPLGTRTQSPCSRSWSRRRRGGYAAAALCQCTASVACCGSHVPRSTSNIETVRVRALPSATHKRIGSARHSRTAQRSAHGCKCFSFASSTTSPRRI